MASNTREAELKVPFPTAEHITELLTAISKLQNRYHEIYQSELGVPSSRPDDYSHEISEILNALAYLYDKLMKVTVLPEFRGIFNLQLNVHTLSPETGKLSSIAETANQWEDVLEAALAYSNKIGPDTIYMAREGIPREVVIHAETKLLVAIEKSEQENPELPRAFPYIGTTEWPCQGGYLPKPASSYSDSTAEESRGIGAVLDFYEDEALNIVAKMTELRRDMED
ncbi:hypothetical protein PVAR5_4789 [Paecilomyces variotii No. 5]|uniref:Uncharacterized protein n=1 Tax=Byssochlamys spectabilis (strain No. 5 / NBRC 109023) TaxID=1356009 RepID=V5I0S7_BYSSN|nr:hypothetical protein PVAR5_4789 [Paecilomyces variotii No. 5]